jgi:hypothetical protein
MYVCMYVCRCVQHSCEYSFESQPSFSTWISDTSPSIFHKFFNSFQRYIIYIGMLHYIHTYNYINTMQHYHHFPTLSPGHPGSSHAYLGMYIKLEIFHTRVKNDICTRLHALKLTIHLGMKRQPYV